MHLFTRYTSILQDNEDCIYSGLSNWVSKKILMVIKVRIWTMHMNCSILCSFVQIKRFLYQIDKCTIL